MNTTESYRKADIEREHGQLEGSDQQDISRPTRNLNFRANCSSQIVSTALKYRLIVSSLDCEVPGLIFGVARRKCSAMGVCHAIVCEAMGDITHTVCQGCLCRIEGLQTLGD
jgi:hypothetical protein